VTNSGDIHGGTSSITAQPPLRPVLAGPFQSDAADAPEQETERRVLQVLLHGPDGTPLDAAKVKTILPATCREIRFPRPSETWRAKAMSSWRTNPCNWPAAFRARLRRKFIVTPRMLKKATPSPGAIEFVVEAAKTRLDRVRRALSKEGQAAKGDAEFEKHLATAARPIPAKPGPEQIAAAYESLAGGLHAGERLVLLAARRRIARLPRRARIFYSAR